MEKSFSNTFSFDTYKKNLFNGSLEILIPNLPQNFNKFHVVVSVTGIDEGEEDMVFYAQPEPIVMQRNDIQEVKKPINTNKKDIDIKEEEKVTEKNLTEHKVYQNRQYRNYVQAVKRARRR